MAKKKKLKKNKMLVNLIQHKDVQEKYKIDDKMFMNGLAFAELIVQGENTTNSYIKAFGVSLDKARSASGGMRRRKWIEELILKIKPDEQTLYFSEIRKIISEGMKIIDKSNDPELKIKAMNTLAKYVKIPTKAKLENRDVEAIAGGVLSQIEKGLEKLARDNKMMNGKGKVIDVKVIE